MMCIPILKIHRETLVMKTMLFFRVLQFLDRIMFGSHYQKVSMVWEVAKFGTTAMVLAQLF
jgi:hypothetical protein